MQTSFVASDDILYSISHKCNVFKLHFIFSSADLLQQHASACFTILKGQVEFSEGKCVRKPACTADKLEQNLNLFPAMVILFVSLVRRNPGTTIVIRKQSAGYV